MRTLQRLALIVTALICPALAYGQGGVPASPVSFTGPTGRPLAGATITFCTSVGTGFPCSPLASIFTNAGLTVASPNPVTTDGNGNIPVVFASPGVYVLSVTGSGITSTLVTATVAGSGGGNVVLSANNAFTGQNSFSQSITAPNISYKTPFDYGAKGNLVTLGPSTVDNGSRAGTFTTATCSITSGQAILTCTGAAFTASDVTKPIVVNFAGAQSPSPCTASFPCALVTTILSQQSASQVTLNATASTTVTNTGLVYYGTDDGAAISSCILNGTLKGGRCTLNNGVGFMLSNAASTINFFSLSQTPIPNGMLDGSGTVLFAPQGVLTGNVNDRFISIGSSSNGPYQLAGQAKYTLAASATGATMSGTTITFTSLAGNFGADIVAGRCIATTGVGVAGYNGTFKVLAGGSGTTAFTVTAPQGITGLAGSGGGSVSISLCPGDTSFTLQNVGDAANFTAGQWVVLREKDNGAGDIVFSDWAQVKSVVSSTINLINPIRMQFPNARTYTTGGGTCSVANPCGLGAISIVQSGLMSGYILRDFNLLIPKIFNTNLAAGISVTLARGIQITDHTCSNAAQNCIFNYLTQGATVKGNTFNTATPNEQASDVDFSVISNHINMPGSSLFGATQTATQAGWDLDFGSAFGNFSGNTFGTSLNSQIASFTGPYYTVISNNTFGWLIGSGGTAIQSAGGKFNQIFGNIGPGGVSPFTGVNVGDTTLASVIINSDGNQVWGNSMSNYPGGNVSCSSAWNTDTCSDPTTQGAQGVQIGGNVPLSSAQFQINFSSVARNLFGYVDTNAASSRHTILFGPSFGVNIHSLRDRTSSRSFWDCYESTGLCNYPVGISLVAGNVLMSATSPTIAAGGCGGAAASIVSPNGTASFKINVGTTPTTACTITMPAAATGWNCFATDITTNSTSVFLQKQTGAESTTSVVITNFSDVAVATAFVASDILKVSCHAD